MSTSSYVLYLQYAMLLVLIMVIEIVAATLVIVYRSKVRPALSPLLLHYFNGYFSALH